MALKELLKAARIESVLVGDLDKYLLSLNQRPSSHGELDGKFHPSQLATGCTRALTLMMMKVAPKADSVAAKGRRIFDVGTDFGRRVQSYLWDMGILEGDWHCRKCGHEWHTVAVESPRVCPDCGATLSLWYNLDYNEIEILGRFNRSDFAPASAETPDSQVIEVVGHADGRLKLSPVRLLEVKTIKNRDQKTHPATVCFDELVGPKDEHLRQLNMYMFCEGVEYGVFLYGAKNTQDVKEFQVKMQYELYVKPQLEKAAYILDCLDNRELPLRKCMEQGKGDAKYCNHCESCFSNKSFDELDNRKK